MPTLFNKKRPPAMSAENVDLGYLQALEMIADFKKYHEEVVVELRSRFEALSKIYYAEGSAILENRRKAQNARTGIQYENELRNWFESHINSIVNDDSPEQKEFLTCTAFELGYTKRYSTIKTLLENEAENSLESKQTQMAIALLQESFQKYDCVTQHKLFYSAYQEKFEDTYQPPAMRMK